MAIYFSSKLADSDSKITIQTTKSFYAFSSHCVPKLVLRTTTLHVVGRSVVVIGELAGNHFILFVMSLAVIIVILFIFSPLIASLHLCY